MKIFDIILYTLWALAPLTLLGFAVWEKLEQWSSKRKEHERAAKEFLQNAFFVFCCVLVALIFDVYLFEMVFAPILPDFVPVNAVRLLLLPIILIIGAKVIGGTKPIRIEKAPTVSKNRLGGRK